MILVTGGLGYIGSHTVVELIREKFKVVIVDNLSNSELFILKRIEQITGVLPTFIKADLTDAVEVETIFKKYQFELVIHFAAYKSVNESVKYPLRYFHNNLGSLINVLQSMETAGTDKLIFSSSATVYGNPHQLPITELAPFQKALSAYGSTKQMAEEILEKQCATGQLRNISLRYFNPVGAHDSALIGELPKGVPNNLFPYIMQTATGKLPVLTVYGNDYNTPDGSCIRDYIHVVDLAKAHVQACNRLLRTENQQSYEVFNLGTGKGTSVLEVINAFEQVTGVKLNYTIGAKREGDAPAVFADAIRANIHLNWKAERMLENMIQTAWVWEKALLK